jgi:hypothetical protein
MAQEKPDYRPRAHMLELMKLFKENELSLVQTPADFSGGINIIGELSLKYYGDKSLWPLIVWANPEELSSIRSADDKPAQYRTIYILHFMP